MKQKTYHRQKSLYILLTLALLTITVLVSCGGGGGTPPSSGGGGEWRGVVTFKGTLREGVYSYYEGKALVTFKYSEATSSASLSNYSIVEGTVTGMFEAGAIDATGSFCQIVTPVTTTPINNIYPNDGWLDFYSISGSPVYTGIGNSTAPAVTYTNTCGFPSTTQPLVLDWLSTDLYEPYDGSNNIYGTFTLDTGVGGTVWEWNLTKYESASGGGTGGGIGEIVVTNDAGNSITVYGRTANGDVAPLRTISGAATGLNGPDDVVVDIGHNEIVVADFYGNSITVYGRTTNGNVAPLRTITGVSTGLNGPRDVVVDSGHNEIFVVPNLFGNSITVYGRTATGNATPLRTISGALTGLNSPEGIAIDTMNNEILVTNRGDNAIRVYSRTANGNVAPLRTITGVATGLNVPKNIEVDTVNNEILVTNGDNAVRVYGRTATGNVAPIRTISGALTGLNGPWGIALLN